MSKVDPAGELAKLLDAAIQKRLAETNVAFPCRVVSFSSGNGLAVVQPLQGGGRAAPVQNVPVLGQRLKTSEGIEQTFFPSLRPGDIVYVVCSDRHIKGETGEAGSSRRVHDANDAVIVGVFPCSLPNS
ncbi:hypothetical protein [Paenibacillus tyrfis]|uniref:Uncharacterized protein n=1 Tax=Paenibacillus tyrfis TaxID=1501230 RepID=A0A081NWQ9_9BACL|nr:hypothetical protein [Paenibacillus tyrfis]KEQ22882.1 hypothetical protein ET33_21295 [Paenibacillus tyrfis]